MSGTNFKIHTDKRCDNIDVKRIQADKLTLTGIPGDGSIISNVTSITGVSGSDLAIGGSGATVDFGGASVTGIGGSTKGVLIGIRPMSFGFQGTLPLGPAIDPPFFSNLLKIGPFAEVAPSIVTTAPGTMLIVGDVVSYSSTQGFISLKFEGEPGVTPASFNITDNPSTCCFTYRTTTPGPFVLQPKLEAILGADFIGSAYVKITCYLFSG